MKTLIKKEIRLLLPAWITAMLLAIVPQVLIILSKSPGNPGYYQGFLSFIAELIFAFGLLFLGINSFGQELNCNTFSALLSQPLKRPRVWLIKIATLATAFALVWLTAILLGNWGLRNSEYSSAFEFLTLSALVAFSGGLWTTLLLRQITTAFWFTLLTPLAIILGINTVFQDWIGWGKSTDPLIVTALLLYSVAGFFLAWRLFMRAQDVQWTGGEVSLPRSEFVSNIGIGSFPGRRGHRFLALAWKELQLHQGTLLIAAVLLVLNLTAVFIRKLHPHIQNPDLEFALAAICILWLLMPLLIGATAIAEERRMGTLEPQLCLPVSRGAQVFVKFCIALILSLVFGALMPLLIEGTQTLFPWHWIFIVAAAIFFVSFYASSLARTTIQGIGLAILVVLTIYVYEALPLGLVTNALAFYGFYGNARRGLELVQNYAGPPVLVIVLGWLTIANFKHTQQNRKFWLRNITAILAAFICIPLLARAIYFRSWELFLTFEPRGPVRITSPGKVKFAATSGDIYSISPDGRLWAASLAYDQVPNGSQSMFNPTSPILASSRRGRFIGNSNWAAVAASAVEAVGIKSDGTLWSLPTTGSPFIPNASHSSTTTQIGADDDWSQIAGGHDAFLILKKDGSLWKSGTSPLNSANRTAWPVRVGDETNWTSVFSADFMAGAKNSSGGTRLFFAYNPFLGTNAISQASNLQSSPGGAVEVKMNGELWYFNNREITFGNTFSHRRWTLPPQQLAEKWKWRTAKFEILTGIPNMLAPDVIAIRDDGTLWRITLSLRPPYEFYSQHFVQLGHRSDWVALGGLFALASDGSVWAWGAPSRPLWLAPSRRPVYMGNIFEEGETVNQPATKTDTP